MKNSKFLTALLLAVSGYLFCQMTPIEIIKVKKDNQYYISLKNNTAKDLDLSLYVTGFGFQEIKTPITKKVPKFEVVEFAEIKPIPNTTEMNFSATYELKREPTEKIIVKK